jgi:glycosyltransferase involved in cell wall biosynthesis
VDWIFFGMCLDELKPYVKEIHGFQLSHQDYISKLASLNLDLAVAPLEIHPFNEAKSNLRLLEYGYLGWPVICSDIYPYQTAPVKHVSNEPHAWIAAIRERIHDLDAAQAEGDRLRQWVVDNYMLEDHLDAWMAALVRA